MGKNAVGKSIECLVAWQAGFRLEFQLLGIVGLPM
jgi:hypothetical protein